MATGRAQITAVFSFTVSSGSGSRVVRIRLILCDKHYEKGK